MRTLDALVAERVMGARVAHKAVTSPIFDSITYLPHAIWNDGGADTSTFLPNYSTDIAAAWMVAEKMQDDGFECKLRLFSSDKETTSATFCKDGHCGEVEHKSMAFAVSTAALLVKGVTQDEIDAAMKQEVNA